MRRRGREAWRFREQAKYVEQEDPFFEALSCEETLGVAACCMLRREGREGRGKRRLLSGWYLRRAVGRRLGIPSFGGAMGRKVEDCHGK